MISLSRVLVVMCVVGSAALPAAADVIYNNGVPNLSAAYTSDFDPSASGIVYESADDFVLGGAVTLQDVHWWGVYATGDTPGSDDFTIRIFADNGGAPGAAAIVEFTGLTVEREVVGSFASSHLYEYSVDVSPTALSGGTTYWISIVNNTSDDSDDTWYWNSSSNSGNAVQQEDNGAWVTDGRDLAFQLTGVREVVPEPASMALLGLGLAGLVVRYRKK